MVRVIYPGFYTSIQDKGRFGLQQFGVPVSGAMDQYSAQLANHIIGNSNEAAVLEATMVGPKLEFQSESCIAITGGNMQPNLNGKVIKLNTSINVKKGDVLGMGKTVSGFRSYLAVGGGFLTEKPLKSRSMYVNITSGAVIKKGDILPIATNFKSLPVKNASVKINTSHFTDERIDVFEGPEFNALTNKQKERLFIKGFTISKLNNRMAYQLEEPLSNNLKPIITSLVLPGTIQLTPSGQLIILMCDCQTTGGYPRILQLSVASINRLAQKNTGNTIVFKMVKQTI